MDTTFDFSRAEAQVVLLNLEKFIERFQKETGTDVTSGAKQIIVEILEQKIGTPMKRLVHGTDCWHLAFADFFEGTLYIVKSCSRNGEPSPRSDAEKNGIRFITELDDGTLCFESLKDFKHIGLQTSRCFSSNFHIAKGDIIIYNPITNVLDVYGDDEYREDTFYWIKPDSSPHKSILDPDYDW